MKDKLKPIKYFIIIKITIPKQCYYAKNLHIYQYD